MKRAVGALVVLILIGGAVWIGLASRTEHLDRTLSAGSPTQPTPSPGETNMRRKKHPPPLPPLPKPLEMDAANAILHLRADGMGSIRFGLRARQAIEYLTRKLGEPDSDSGWTAPGGACPHFPNYRLVSWDNLDVIFGHLIDMRGNRRFAGWSLTRPTDDQSIDVTTSRGVGAESTLKQLRAAYGKRLNAYRGAPGNLVYFFIRGRTQSPGATNLGGELTSLKPLARVRWIDAGGRCGE